MNKECEWVLQSREEEQVQEISYAHPSQIGQLWTRRKEQNIGISIKTDSVLHIVNAS